MDAMISKEYINENDGRRLLILPAIARFLRLGTNRTLQGGERRGVRILVCDLACRLVCRLVANAGGTEERTSGRAEERRSIGEQAGRPLHS